MRDESLEVGFARRDGAAFEAAYRTFSPRMYATALGLLADPEAAGECIHDVFLDLWRRGCPYSAARGSLEAFLVTCARNRALMQLRSQTRRTRMAGRLEPPQEYRLEEDPLERERIGRAIEQLTQGQAEVVRRAYYTGMTLNEVASDLQIPVGTVKGRLSAALRALRRSLVTESP